ncbi:MAG: hypothetical protein WCD77_10225, partial [Acidobacteriaceae bacterium]
MSSRCQGWRHWGHDGGVDVAPAGFSGRHCFQCDSHPSYILSMTNSEAAQSHSPALGDSKTTYNRFLLLVAG